MVPFNCAGEESNAKFKADEFRVQMLLVDFKSFGFFV